MSEKELRERLAEIQHQIWSDWMEYLFSVSYFNDDGSVTIPAGKAVHWQILMVTCYSALLEEIKESDRQQADKVLVVMTGWLD